MTFVVVASVLVVGCGHDTKSAQRTDSAVDDTKPAHGFAAAGSDRKPAHGPVAKEGDTRPARGPVAKEGDNKPAHAPVVPVDDNQPARRLVAEEGDTKPAKGPILPVGDNKPARQFEKAAGFSFVPPKGWTMTRAADLAESDAASEKLAKEVQEKYDAATQRIRQAFQAQLKAAPPGSFQEKVAKQQLDQLEKQAKPQADLAERSAKIKSRSILMCSGSSENDGLLPYITFSELAPGPAVKDKAAKIKLADAVANYKYVADHTNEFSGVVAQKKLKTDASQEFVVLVTKLFPADYFGDVDDRVELRITHYFLEASPGRVLLVTCSAPTDSKLDAVFEATLKTFRLE
jgi:hypothetical protein